jgi:hypothetical protein
MAEIRDGDAFSIVLPDAARPCLLYPPELFDRDACPRDAEPMAEAPGMSPDSRVLAFGSVRADDHGATAVATIVATVTHLAHNAEPGSLKNFAKVMADGLVKSRPGATLRTGPVSQFVTVGETHGARITFEIDGLSAQGLDHVVSYSAWSESGDYNVTFMSTPAHAMAVDSLADQAATTLHVAKPAPPRNELGHRIEQVTLGVAGALFVPAVVWIVVSRSRRKGVGSSEPK